MENSKDNPMWGVLNTLDLAPTNDNPNLINASNNPQISINNNLLTSPSVMLNMAEISNEVSALMDDSGWAMQAPTPLPTSPDLNNDAASRLSFSDFFSSADDLLNDCNVLFTENSTNNCNDLTPKNFPNPTPAPMDYTPNILSNQCQTGSKQQQQSVTIINFSSAPPSEDRFNTIKKNMTRTVFSDVSKMDQTPSTSAAVRIDHQTYCSLAPIDMKDTAHLLVYRYKTRPALLQHLSSKHDSNTALIGMVFANLPPNSSKLDSLVDEVVSNCRNQTHNSNINEISTNNNTNQSPTMFACGFCAFSSVNFSDVYRHKLTMHLNNGENGGGNVPSYSETSNNIQHNDNICLYCFKKFASSNNLLAHIRKQHLQAAKTSRASRKTYSCSKCSFTTTRKKVLKAHEDYIRHPDDQNDRSTEVDNRIHNRPYYANNSTISNDRAPDFSNSTFYGRNPSTKQQQQIIVQKRPVVNNKQITTPVNNGFTPQSSLIGGLNGKDSGCYDSSWNETYDLGNRVATTMVNGRFENANLAQTDEDRFPSVSKTSPPSSSSSSTFESMAACVEHLQMANGSLLHLCRRRETELKSLRANVLELLKRVYHRDGGGAVVTLANHTLEDVDGLVIDAINSTLLTNGTNNNNNH
uniref:C2H2-type domain-containing protein n=1 Tax=Romanomermis culicivorax TaxID=13658 RepID=A0A915JR41_ROMCU